MNHAGAETTLVANSAQKTMSHPAGVRLDSHFEFRRLPNPHSSDPYARPTTVGSQKVNGLLLSSCRCATKVVMSAMPTTAPRTYCVPRRLRSRVVSAAKVAPPVLRGALATFEDAARCAGSLSGGIQSSRMPGGGLPRRTLRRLGTTDTEGAPCAV
ncbi:hypothetical protein GCM10009627_10630 [Curtobacterium herbarum]|uniref:Uncharacterized protein n=1 Tax=Curtobacterium herbarum TaxID=150122 RepID=A0ABP4K1Q3_9MICO